MDLNFLIEFSNELDSKGFYKDAEVLDNFMHQAATQKKRVPNWKNIGIALSPIVLGLLASKFNNQHHNLSTQNQQPSLVQQLQNHQKVKSNYHLPKGNYKQFREFIKEQEGGLTDRPLTHDPGGLTNKGITQKEYTKYLKSKKIKNKSVKYISDQEVNEITKTKYWNILKADHLPQSVALAIADWKFNGGWRPAYIQEILGIPITNKLDKHTIMSIWKAIDNNPAKEMKLVQKLISRRQQYLESLRTTNKQHKKVPLINYNPGWYNRLNDLKDTASDNAQKSISELDKTKLRENHEGVSM